MKYYLFIFAVLFLTLSSKKINCDNVNPKNQVKRFYYNDGVLAIEKWYGTDKIIDSLKTFYKSGKSNEFFYFDYKGRIHGECKQLDSYGEMIVDWNFKHGKLLARKDYKIVFNKNNEEKIRESHARLKKLNTNTKYNPSSFKDRLNRAFIRYRLGNTTLALNDFKILEKAFKKVSKNKKIPHKIQSNLYDALGGIYSSYENENFALHYRNKAINISPNEGRLYYNMGAYLYEIKAYRLAINYLNKTKEFWPKHAFSNWVLGAIYSDLEENEKAMEYINIAFERENNLYKYGSGNAEMDIRTIRGLLYHKLGDTKKGIADLNEALALNKNNSFALRNLGVIYHDLEKYNKACEFLQKAKDLNYEKIFDRDDLQYFLDISCNNTSSKPYIGYSKMPYIYPNPTKDILQVQNYNYKNFDFEIYNYQSKLILKGISNDTAINISSLSSGLYILKILNMESQQTFRVIKQ